MAAPFLVLAYLERGNMNSRKALFVLSLAAVCGSAVAQSRSSFMPASFTGVTITPSNGGLTYLLSLSAAPTITVGASTFAITEVFGFWALDDEDPNLVGSASSFGVWSVDFSGASDGAIRGWKTNPNQGVMVGGSETFNYTTLDVNDVEEIGLHVRVDRTLVGGGNTGYFEYNAVPEPATVATPAIGALALIRRKRR